MFVASALITYVIRLTIPSIRPENIVRILVSLSLALMISPIGHASEFDDLVQKVPRGGNAIMAVDVAKTLATPIAQKNGWDKKFSDSTNSPLYLPPEADKVLAVAQFDIVRDFNRGWDFTIFGLTESIPLRLVARAEGGYVDTVAGTDAVWIPGDAYILQAGEKTLVMQAPANRQAIARWIEGQKSSSLSQISDYLGAAVAAMKRDPHIVMALDASNAPQPHRVKEQLQQSGFIEKHSVDLEQLTSLVSGLRGVVLEVTLTDKIAATARIDFSEKVTLNSTVAKALVLATLNARQMSLPGIDTWNCSTVDKSIVMDGALPIDSLRRLLSLMEPPSTKFSSLKEANVETASGDEMAKSSQAYFRQRRL